MKWSDVLLCLSISTCLIHPCLCYCPRECKCSSDGVIDCSRANLDTFPRDIPFNAHTLDLSHNSISQFPDLSEWLEYSQIRNLDVSHNLIQCFDSQFIGSKVQNVDLRSNRLRNLRVEKSLENLKVKINDDDTLNDCQCSKEFIHKFSGVSCTESYFSPHAILCGTSSDDVVPGESICLEQEAMCPKECHCNDGIVDCRDKKLDRFPSSIPHSATELRLEQNNIGSIPKNAFAKLKWLRRIDLSNNKIRVIPDDTFNGLPRLTSLVLYGNQIERISGSSFYDLPALQLLLLNSNKIRCIHPNAFNRLEVLHLLSLYDNNIQTLSNGTFDGLENLQTLHLGKNSFACGCDLAWLTTWLQKNPVETSGARCETPVKLQRKKISTLHLEQSNCLDLSGSAPSCNWTAPCPFPCSCSDGIVDCSGRGVKVIPSDLPKTTRELQLSGNVMDIIPSVGLFNLLPSLNTLNMSQNFISVIEEGSFEGARTITILDLSHNSLSTIRGRLLRGLDGLTTLYLHNNNIHCISPGAFDMLPKLSFANILSNPIQCDCHMAWFGDWLRSQNNTSAVATCATPTHLKNRQLQDLPLPSFRCKGSADEGCLEQHYCPRECVCTGTVIRCSHAQLKHVPNNVPKEASELYLDVNDITDLKMEQFSHLQRLSRLDISNNKISVIKPYVFANLTRLSTLIISYNEIKCIQPKAFSGLHHLRILSLHGNSISMIPKSAFDDQNSITHLALGSNPLLCDCNLKWLSQWMKSQYIEPGIAKCSHPNSLSNHLVLTTPESSFKCQGETPQDILAKCDPCHMAPCQNNATCKAQHGLDFMCDCVPGYYGVFCEKNIDACYGNPCSHDGTCTVMEHGRFECNCPLGYSGLRCEFDINECASNPCHNDAKCIDQIGSFACDCKEGFTGDICDKEIDPCEDAHEKCLNEGTCVPGKNTFSCACRPGFSGPDCSISLDDCRSHMCQNGGTCLDGNGTYSCACTPEFAGKYCELEPIISHLYPQSSPCQQHECKHGTCFMPKDSKDYVCKCDPGYTGKYCEYLTSLSFDQKGAYAQMEPLNTQPFANVTMEVITLETSGILIYVGQNEHLAVELFKGRIRVSYDVGNYPVSTMFSYEKISDGLRHRIQILAHGKNLTLKVDQGQSRSIVNEGANSEVQFRTPLYVAGCPDNVGEEALKHWHLRNISSFQGCMPSLHINDKLVDFLQAADVRHKVSPGCSMSEVVQNAEPEDPCIPSPCKHGTCSTIETVPGFKCTCNQGFSGVYCNQKDMNRNFQRDRQSKDSRRVRNKRKKKCKKQKYRDYYIDQSGCRSKRPYKMAKCVSDTSDSCVAKKTKLRTIRFICQNGRNFNKEVEMIRKCGRIKQDKRKLI